VPEEHSDEEKVDGIDNVQEVLDW